MTAAVPTQEDRLGYILNRAQLVGRMRTADLVADLASLGMSVPSAMLPTTSVFDDVNLDSSDERHWDALEAIARALEAPAAVAAVVDRLVRQTGQTVRDTGRVGVSTEFDATTATACDAWWEVIGTLAHELMHPLAHPSFLAAASAVGSPIDGRRPQLPRRLLPW